MVIRVLVVDDHAPLRRSVERVLASAPDIECVGGAGDGEAGIRAAQEHEPDVVVMDLAMAPVDGLEATRRIRAAVPASHVVVFTAVGGPRVCERALAAGASEVLPKDVPPEELVAAIRRSAGAGRCDTV